MTTGPENPYGEQEPGTPPTHQPYGTPPPPAPPYGTPPPYGAPAPYGAPQQGYQQPGYGQPAYPYASAPPTDGLALGSMITGIAAIVLSCAYGLGLLAAPVALILGKVSLNRIKRSQGQLGGQTSRSVRGSSGRRGCLAPRRLPRLPHLADGPECGRLGSGLA